MMKGLLTVQHTLQKQEKSRGGKYSEAKPGWAFLSPWIIGFILFSGFPIIFSFILSLTRWNLLGTPKFIGFENYATLFSPSSAFGHTLIVTFAFSIISVIVTIAFSLILAILLNLKVRFKGLFQFFYYVPTIMPSVVMASCMILMFNQQLGVVDYVLRFLGVSNPPNWLGDQGLVWVVIGVASVFTFQTGQQMLVFSAALKDVPQDLHEAASIDGANAISRFWHITLPGIAPILLFNTISASVNSFNGAFTLLYPLTGGGPGDATKVMSLLIYDNAFTSFNMGYASALAVVLFIIVAVVGTLQFRLMDRN